MASEEIEEFKDYELAQLIVWANKGGLEMPLTLIISGSLLTGKLISVSKYFELFAEQMHGAFSSVDAEAATYLQEFYQNRGKDVEKQLVRERINDALDNTGYIHLSNASIVSGNTLTPQAGSLFRCRISHVSGYSLGQIILTK